MDNCGECAELLQEGCEDIIGVCPESPVVRDYNAFTNKPSINGVTLVGNKTSDDLGITQQITEAVQAESTARQEADRALQQEIDDEETAREQADTTLDGRITANATAIGDEALARQQADNGLQTQIDAITSQSDVVDVVANYAALQAYDTSSLSDNDVIKVLDDETHEDALTYYRWSTTTQTWTYIGQEAPYYSKGQMDVMLQGKQDTLTAGANIQIENGTISATDTTYTAGNGLNLNDTEFSADTDILATKEDLEGYYTKPETDNLLAPKLEAEVVAELPTAGEEGKLYLTPKAHTTQTATGNPITATVAEDAGKIESFQLDGDTFQQTYEGKNLLKLAGNWAIVQGSGVTVTDGDDGSIILNGTVATRQDIRIYSTSDRLRIESGTEVTLSRNTNNYNLIWHRFTTEESSITSDVAYIAANGEYSRTYTTASTDYGYQLVLRLLQGTVFNNEKIYLQLEKGSTATSFERYVGGQPSPNPDYPQPIQTVTGLQTVEIIGKNLFDKNDVEVGTILMNGGFDPSYADARTTGYVPVLPNTAYVTRGRPNGWGIEAFYTKDKTFIQRVTTVSFTTPANCYFVRLECHRLDLDTCQCELGSTVTAYAPYSKQTLPLDLGPIELHSLGGNYLDRIFKDGNDWKIHKATTDRTLSGSTYWATDGLGRYYTNSIADYSRSNNAPVSTHFEGTSNVSAMGDTPDGKIAFNNSTTADRLYIGKFDEFTSVSVLTQWLNENSPSICYALATPTDIIITDQTLIAQLEAIRTALLQNGANTITNTATGSNLAGDMEIGYYGFAPRNRYDKWLWLDINNEYEQIGS